MDECLTSSNNHIFDLIGIGFGPSNIALAIALEESGQLDRVLFLESRNEPCWQPGMVLDGTDIQHHPLRDFVTPRNPVSQYGFLSYLKAQSRLLEYLNLDTPYPPRSEYEGYVKWVARHFEDKVAYSCHVDSIERIRLDGDELIRITAGKNEYLARNISLGTGRSPNIPSVFTGMLGPRVVHLNDYLGAVKHWTDEGLQHVTVVGSSQSGAEIVLDLLNRNEDLQVCSLSRSFGFKHKDLSPFTEQIYMPEFLDYFFNASSESQRKMTNELWRSNYGAADPDVIHSLNLINYEQLVLGQQRLQVQSNKHIHSVNQGEDGGYVIAATDVHSNQTEIFRTDAILLATGFLNFGDGDAREPMLTLMQGLQPKFNFREDGGVEVNQDYSLRFTDEGPSTPKVFLNGLCEASHGFGDAGSFSLLWLRSAIIAESIYEKNKRKLNSLSSRAVAQ